MFIFILYLRLKSDELLSIIIARNGVVVNQVEGKISFPCY